MFRADVTQTENPYGASDFTKSLMKNVIPALEKAGLLPAVSGAPVALGQQPGISQPMRAPGR